MTWADPCVPCIWSTTSGPSIWIIIGSMLLTPSVIWAFRARSTAVNGLPVNDIVMPLIGPLLVLFNGVVQGIYVVIPSRYGLSISPALPSSSSEAGTR